MNVNYHIYNVIKHHDTKAQQPEGGAVISSNVASHKGSLPVAHLQTPASLQASRYYALLITSLVVFQDCCILILSMHKLLNCNAVMSHA